MDLSILNDVKLEYSGSAQITDDIRSLSIQIIELRNAIGNHVIRMCYLLHKLKPMLDNEFQGYCEDVFGFSRHQIWKFSNIGELIEKKFLSNGRAPDMSLLSNFGTEAMLLLSTKADDEVIDGAKDIAAQGQKVRTTDVEALLRAQAEAKEALDEVALKERELARANEQILQLNAHAERQRKALEAATKLVDTKTSQLTDADQEIERLQREKREMQTSMKSRPIEAQMSTTQDPAHGQAQNLLDGINAEITRAQERKDKLKAETEAAQRALADMAGKLGASKQAAASLDDLVSEIDGVIAKFPDTLLGKLRGTLPGAEARLNDYADKLRDLANHISS